MQKEKRLELRTDSDGMVLELWRVYDDKTMIKLNGKGGELSVTVNSGERVEEFLKDSLFYIKELGI